MGWKQLLVVYSSTHPSLLLYPSLCIIPSLSHLYLCQHPHALKSSVWVTFSLVINVRNPQRAGRVYAEV